MAVRIEESWHKELQEEFKKPYFEQLIHTLKTDKKAGKVIYPAGKDIFSAFDLTPFKKIKVVILGQDPYHGEGQAHGLCFSVQKGTLIPPSLKNIYKELQADLGFITPHHGDLSNWAKQGVFLLNASLTVEHGQPMSHAKIGWETFTDYVIEHISSHLDHVVFLLWGRFAKNKAHLIDATKHKILMAAHPSPFSAHNGFFGCKHFSKTNTLLSSFGEKEINWQL